MRDVPLGLWAPLSGLVYFLVSLRVREFFPFSFYEMYSESANRNSGAVPFFLADGKEVPLGRYHRFKGIDPETLYPTGMPCSMEWKVTEAKRWIAAHPAAAGEPAGPVRVQWGFRILSIDADGLLAENVHVVSVGTAWKL